MNVNEFFKLIDEAAALDLPELFAGRLAREVAASGWKPGDGLIPGHFANKLPGHRLLWSCSWATSRGVIGPNQLIPVEHATSLQLVLEAADYVSRSVDSYGARSDAFTASRLGALLVEYFTDTVQNPENWLGLVRAILRPVRETYPEFVAAWDAPSLAGDERGFGRLLNVQPRPSWSDQATLARQVGAWPREKTQ